MTEDFSANPKKIGNFTQSTETDLFQGFRDHSEFLPVVNRTESIQRFFGSTVNQLLSSGSTQTIDSYWGRLNGRSYNHDQESFQPEADATRLNYQFVPGTVRREAGQIKTAVSYINWIKRLNSYGADTDNHDRLFHEPGYTLDLPINIDMFVNYNNYFWLEGNMPVIDITPTSSDPIDIDTIVGLDQYTTPVLSTNKSLEFVTGLRVRFVGANVSSTSNNYSADAVYYIENVGGHGGINFVLSEDATGNDAFSTVTPYTILYPKGWDLDPWDTTKWDKRGYFHEYNSLTTLEREDISLNKTYIVMERWAQDMNPWARSNRWFSVYALRTFGEFTGVDIEPYLNRRTRAQRPIIEWQANLELFNFCKNFVENVTFAVTTDDVDAMTGATSYSADNGKNFLQDNDIVLVVSGDDSHALYATSHVVSGVGTAIVLTAHNTYSADEYVLVTQGDRRGINYCFDGAEWSVAQSKTNKNTAPLFNLYSDTLQEISALDDTDFAGDKVFGYKESTTGVHDSELGFAPVYSAGQGLRNFEFEFTLNNNRYRKNVSLTSAEDITGYYSYHNWTRNEYFNGWSAIRDGQRVPVVQTVMADGKTNPTFNLGTTKTEYTTEYAITWLDGAYRWLTRSYIDQLDIGRNNPDLVWKRDTDYVIQNLIPAGGTALVLTDPYGNADAEISTAVDTSANTITVSISSDYAYNKVLYGGGEIVLSESNQQRYQLRRNGQLLIENTDYTVIANTNTVEVTATTNNGDVLELSYIADSDLTNVAYDVAPVHFYNSTNEPFTGASYSEMFSHFDRQVTHMPGFEGKIAGENNYHRTRRIHAYDGLVRQQIFEAPKVEYLFDQEKINPVRVLKTFSDDYTQFKTFFKSKVKQLWETESWSSVRDIVDRALSDINIGKNENFKYANSDMAYFKQFEQSVYSINNNDLSYRLPRTQNTYGDTQNHIQVWLKEYDGLLYTERQLEVNTEYTIVGQNVVLASPALRNGATPATLTVRWHSHGINSHIPFSAAKLGFFRPTQVEIINGVLIGHDGSHHAATNTEFYNMDSVDFDIVTASLLDYERRVFNNLVNEHFTAFDMAEQYPSPHRPFAYDVEDLNSRLDDWYNRYAHRENIAEIDTVEYDAGNEFTWNYSTVGPQLGSWRSLYTFYFGTDRPHTHPWEMLGYRTKPTWWDANYSWLTGSPDRVALIAAVKTGLTSQPGTPIVTDPKYARNAYHWDESTPLVEVNLVNGNPVPTLADPVAAAVVTTPAAIDSSKPFVFGDWGEIENTWRKSSEHSFALAEAYLQMKPYRTHELWWTLGRWKINNKITQSQWVDTDTCLRMNSSEIHNQLISDGVITGIKVVEGGSGYSTASVTFPANAICSQSASATLFTSNGAVDAAAITNPGREYATTPIDTVIQGPATSSGAVLEYVIDFDFYATHLGFNTLPAEEFTPEQSDSSELAVDLSGLSMEHIMHVGGFTDKRIMSLNIDSSYENGRTDIPQKNYDIVLDKGAPIKTAFFSGVKIEKVQSMGYQVSGYNLDSRFFSYTPVSSSGKSVSESVGTTTINRHLNFKNETVRIPYGFIFTRRQELYSFLIGLANYYETIGFLIETQWLEESKDAIRWALSDSVDAFFISGATDTLTYNHGIQGYVDVADVNYNGVPNVLNYNHKQINKSNLLVLRNETTTEYSLKTAQDRIYGLGVQVVELEHIIAIHKTTEFNDVIYNPAKGIAQKRVRFNGEMTRNWNGRLEAPGYLIRDTGLLLNMESTVREVERDWINAETKKLERLSRQTMGYNVGYAQPTYLKDTFVDGTASYRFEQGERKYKGTKFAFDAMSRNKNIFGKEFGQQLYEDWMVRLGDFGDMTEVEPLQFEINPDLIKGDPQQFRFSLAFVSDNLGDSVIDLYAGGPLAVSGDYQQPFDQHSFLPLNNDKISISNEFQHFNKDAGLPLVTEIDYFVRSVDDIGSVYDVNADYAQIRNWNNVTAYTKGDVVRLGSRVYQLSAESTGVAQISADITIRGNQVFPIVSTGDTFIASGNTITFAKSSVSTTVETIVVPGTISNPSIPSSTTLTLDGININFIKNQTSTVFNDIVIDGTVSNPQIENSATASFLIGYANNNTDPLTTVSVLFNETISTETLQQIWIDAFSISYGATAISDAITRINALEALRVAYIAENSSAAWITWIDDYYATASSASLYVNPQYVGIQIAANLGATWEDKARDLIDIDLTIIANISGNASTESQTSLIAGPLNDSVQFNADVSAAHAVIDASDNISDFAQYMYDNPTQSLSTGLEISVTSPDPNRYKTDTLAEIVTKINDALPSGENIEAYSQNGVLRITRTNNIENYRLVIQGSSINSALGFVDNTEGVLTGVTSTVGVDLTLIEAVTAINQAQIAGVTAASVSGVLQISSNNDLLQISQSTAIDHVGLPVGNIAANSSTSTADVNLTIYDVVDQINTSNIPNLTAEQIDGALVLTFVGSQFVIGNGTSNVSLGLVAGTFESQSQSVNNSFIPEDWNTIQEPADFSIWAVDNIGGNNRSIQTTSNRYQVYKTSDIDLEIHEICQGTELGNDALVKCVKPHQLVVNDYVIILNSSSLPSVDGIHRVTGVLNNNMFFVDEYIDSKGFTGKAIPLRTTRVSTQEEADNLLTDTRYIDNTDGQFGLVSGSLIYVDQARGDSGELLPYGKVLQLIRESDGASFVTERLEEAKTDNSKIVNGILYTQRDKNTVAHYEVFNPLEGIVPGVAEAEIDIRNEVDLAKYNSTTDAGLEINPNLRWGKEKIGLVWWDLSNATYLNYNQGTDKYRQEYWGELFPTSTIDVYEWTKSPVTPDAYSSAVRAGTIVDGVPLTGSARTQLDDFGDEQYNWTEEFEVNVNTNQIEVFYYFWVRDKTTVPSASRIYTVDQLAGILTDPTTVGLNWVAATGTNALLVNGLEKARGYRDLVMQINFNSGEVDYHQEFALLAEGDPKTVIPEWLHIRLRDSLAGFSQRTKTTNYTNWLITTVYNPQDVVKASNGRFYIASQSNIGSDPVLNTNNNKWQAIEEVTVNPDGDYNGADTVEYSLAKNIPDLKLHPYERIGINARPSQTMFADLIAARKSAVEKLNSQMRKINLVDSNLRWREEFDRSLQVGNETVDIREYWSYVNWNAITGTPHEPANAVYYVSDVTELDDLNATDGEVAQITSSDYSDRIERQSAYRYEFGSWTLIFREKATIEFNDLLWNNAIALAGWDIAAWDTTPWDKDSKYAFAAIIDSFYKKLYIEQESSLYVDFWFHMAKYVLGEQDEVDWLFKSSYINFVFEDSLEKNYNKYYNEKVDAAFDYINAVKPFRSKINDAVVQKSASETTDIALSETVEIRIQTNPLDENVDTTNTRSFRLSHGTTGNNRSSQIVNDYKQILAADIGASTAIIPVLSDGITGLDAGPGAVWINGERIEYTDMFVTPVEFDNAFDSAFNSAFNRIVFLTGVTRGTQETLPRSHKYADTAEQETGFELTQNSNLSDWNNSIPNAWQSPGTSLLDTANNSEANGVAINAQGLGTINATGTVAARKSLALSQDKDAITSFNNYVEGLMLIYLGV
jgi:hypothetical protein